MFTSLGNSLFAHYLKVNLFPVYSLVPGCSDANAHLVALYAQDGHGNVIANHQALVGSSSEY
jgi:hypothetical protein